MRIFLTGGTGFIGCRVLRQAIAAGHEVVAIRRPGSDPVVTVGHEALWVHGQLRDHWKEHMSGCDALLHLAAFGVSTGSNNWEECFQYNVVDSLNLWKQAIEVGVQRFLVVGSCFEYGRSGERYDTIPVTAPLEPTTAYGASKAAATMAALALAVENQLTMVVARPFHVYGPGESSERFWPSLMRAARAGEDLRMTAGTQVRDFQPVEETAQQLLSWLVEAKVTPGKPELVNLGTGNAMTLKAFAEREWTKLRARGRLKAGEIAMRKNEVQRYVPMVTPLVLGSIDP